MSWRSPVLIVIALGCAAAAAAAVYAFRWSPIVTPVTRFTLERVRQLRHGFAIEHDVMLTMRDGVRLATDLYLPRERRSGLATILIRLPYDKNRYEEARDAAHAFASRGYAVAVQDVRGKFASGGEFQPWRFAAEDGSDTLDWIASQPWSNGRVGTFGCSALGETQVILSSVGNAHHVAAIALGAGGAMGSARGRHGYFGLYEGGVFQLASGYGWFLSHGNKHGGPEVVPQVDRMAALRGLPIEGLVARNFRGPNDYADFLRHPPGDSWWDGLGYVRDGDTLSTPTLHINNWFDQTVAETFIMAQIANDAPQARADPSRRHQVVIGPGNHCGEAEVAATGAVGDLSVGGAAQPYWDWYLAWFDARLRDGTPPALPPYLFHVVGEDRWLASDAWPPRAMVPQRWGLGSREGANGRDGDGVLRAPAADTPPAASRAFDEYRYDPADPVPSRGGPICCTGTPESKPGPVDQRDVESRRDVLVYTSAPLARPLRIAGPLSASIVVSSSAPDTDFVVRLVDVGVDGRAINVQEGALRARYRNGFDRPTPLVPGEAVRVEVDMRVIAWYFRAGHRLRLHVTSSSFPRLERNLNTGGRNYDEAVAAVATNRVYLARDGGSWVLLPVVDELRDGLTAFDGRAPQDAGP